MLLNVSRCGISRKKIDGFREGRAQVWISIPLDVLIHFDLQIG
jgi:hypothetical protein